MYSVKLFMFCSVVSLVSNQHFTDSDTLTDASTNNKKQEETNCTCLPYYQCAEDSGRVITDGTGLLDARGLHEDSLCKGYFDVCCNVPPVTTAPTRKLPPKNDNDCGFLKETVIPWSGALLTKNKLSPIPDYRCGIAIIHPRLALTTAHCPDNKLRPDQYQLSVGDDLTSVIKIIKHPDYNPRTLQNDIALLLLQDSIGNGTICIPPPSSEFLTGQCTVTSWKKSGQLRVIEVPLVDHHKCEQLMRKTRLGQYFQLHEGFICAGGSTLSDPCDGDGGSPLICPIPGQPERYHQVGIVSWGIGCGERNTPGVYVNVARYRNWIDSVVKSYNLGGEGINAYRY